MVSSSGRLLQRTLLSEECSLGASLLNGNSFHKATLAPRASGERYDLGQPADKLMHIFCAHLIENRLHLILILVFRSLSLWESASLSLSQLVSSAAHNKAELDGCLSTCRASETRWTEADTGRIFSISAASVSILAAWR